MEGRGMAKIGTIGDLTCFSFYATKNFTSAEGGAITHQAMMRWRKKSPSPACTE